MEPAPVAITLQVVEALEGLGVPYFITGPLASAIHGLARSTVDVDLVADPSSGQEEPFRAALGDGFYADIEAIRQAVRWRGSFNLVHRETMYKVDVFVSKARFQRRSAKVVADPERRAFVATAEDVVLAKLECSGGTARSAVPPGVGFKPWVADLLERAIAEVSQEGEGHGPP